MSAEADVLRDVISRLENAAVPYMVTGSVAMSYYAQPRMTRDVDIVVELAARAASQVVDLFAPDYYVPMRRSRLQSARTGCSIFSMSKNW